MGPVLVFTTRQQRLEYIATHTDGLTGTYLKMIISELPGRFLGKGGCNADLAVDIANHCGYEAQAGRSDLLLEKLLIKRVYGMCYGACRDSESEGEADSDDEYGDEYGEPYIIPQEVKNRLMYCCDMLEAFDLKALRQTMKKLPKYNGRRKGELYDVFSDVTDHLDDLAARKADVVAETAMIEKIQARFTARKKADENDDDEY
ncbi:hypothetical protein C8R43DRAFT_1013555 [Mycena crocata]|nr:hypothetical protein C8R43DRAFT_1013555 [Mycena crocata]